MVKQLFFFFHLLFSSLLSSTRCSLKLTETPSLFGFFLFPLLLCRDHHDEWRVAWYSVKFYDCRTWYDSMVRNPKYSLLRFYGVLFSTCPNKIESLHLILFFFLFLLLSFFPFLFEQCADVVYLWINAASRTWKNDFGWNNQ